jgi:hypothetical protein
MKNVVLRVTGAHVYNTEAYIHSTRNHTSIHGKHNAQVLTRKAAELFIKRLAKIGYIQTFEIEDVIE